MLVYQRVNTTEMVQWNVEIPYEKQWFPGFEHQEGVTGIT